MKHSYFKNKKYKELIPTVFFIILLLSMLDEDTLETSVGVSFVAVFYSLLILQKIINDKNNSNDCK